MHASKRHYAQRLKEHQKISDIFLVLQKNLAVGRSNRPYLRLTLGDRTGQVEARVWDGAEAVEPLFRKGDVVAVEGRVTLYQGTLQINVDDLAPLSEKDRSSVDWSDFLPAAERPAEEMWGELLERLSAVEDPSLRALLGTFTEDPELRQRFCQAPAAKGIHHVYLGGLLEHTLGVVRLAGAVAGLYPVDGDLLLTGAFLHDVGKTRELTYAAGFDYSDAGRLLGHIVLGLEMLRDKAAEVPGLAPDRLLHLEHLILSHHGELEWGSPKRPKTLEAMLLHALDNLDAKLAGAGDWLAREEGVEGNWTAFWKPLGRALYRGARQGAGATGDPADESVEDQLLRAAAAAEGNGRESGPGTQAADEAPPKSKTAQRDFGF